MIISPAFANSSIVELTNSSGAFSNSFEPAVFCRFSVASTRFFIAAFFLDALMAACAAPRSGFPLPVLLQHSLQ